MESYQVPNETESFSFHSTMKVSASNDMRANGAGRYKHEKHKDNYLFPHVNFLTKTIFLGVESILFPFKIHFTTFTHRSTQELKRRIEMTEI